MLIPISETPQPQDFIDVLYEHALSVPSEFSTVMGWAYETCGNEPMAAGFRFIEKVHALGAKNKTATIHQFPTHGGFHA